MHNLSLEINQPWLIAGDFNALLAAQDRIAGAAFKLAEVRDFKECDNKIGVSELPWKGEDYTLSNKQHGADWISSRIDKAFGNYEWMMQWGHVTNDYGNPSTSYHCPMRLMQEPQRCDKVAFKFFNIWTVHETFRSIVEGIWIWQRIV